MINIPYRKNGQRITASWFNRIRQYLSNLFLSGKRLKINPTDNKPIDYYVSVGNEFLNHEPDSLIIVEDGVPGVHNTIHLPPIEDIDLQFTIKNLSDELLDIVTTETDIVNGDTIELLNDVKNKLVLRKNESVTVHADAYRPEWNVIGNVVDNFFKTEKDTDGVRNVSIDGTDNAYLKLNEPLDIQNCRLRFSDESQKLEYSTDKGVTWNKVEGSGGGGSSSTPFAINSGYAENGHNAIMSGVGTNTINFNTTVPIKVTTASGKTGELVKVDPVTVSNDGTFNVFVDAITGNVRLYANKVYIQSETPTAENNFDVWLDTTIEPMTLKQWSGTAWVERDNFIWFGSVIVASGNIAEIRNEEFGGKLKTWGECEFYETQSVGVSKHVCTDPFWHIILRARGGYAWHTEVTSPNGKIRYYDSKWEGTSQWTYPAFMFEVHYGEKIDIQRSVEGPFLQAIIHKYR